MARKGYGRNSTLVNITTHADDGTSPVGSNEWNENPNTDGILGLTKSTQAISSNNIDVTDSYIEVTNIGDIYTLSAVTTSLSATNYASDATSSISEGDLIYVVKAAGLGTVNLKHQNGGAGAGKITTLTAGDKALSATVPTILMARTIGSVLEWVEYGGGAVADLSITTAKLAADAITGAKLADDAVAAEHIAANAVVNASVASGAAIATSKLSGALTSVASHGLAASATTDTTNASNISSGTLAAGLVATLNQNTTGSSASCTGLSATATLATQATTVTCTDNAANETVYPTFVDGATGAQDLETDTGLNYNPSTGLLSAVGLTLSGDLTVNGTNTILNTATLEVEDKDIVLAKVSSPSNTTANGAGIIIEAGTDTDKSILWDSTNSNFTSTEHVNIATGKSFKVNNTALKDVAETLTNKSIVASQLTGTIADARMPDLTGEVTTTEGAVATTIADNIIDEANLKVNNSPTDGYVLKALASASGGLTWGTGGGGATTLHKYTASNQTTVFTVSANSIAYDVGTTVASQAAGAGQREIYIRKIDTNNEGVFTIIHKNGALVEVQIA